MCDLKREIRFGYGQLVRDGRCVPAPANIFPTTAEERYPDAADAHDLIVGVQSLLREYGALKDAGKTDAAARVLRQQQRRASREYHKAAVDALKFTANSIHGVFERLVYFWRNHFAVTTFAQASYTAGVLSYEVDSIRPFVDGKFKEMLRAAVTHPLMLRSLGQALSYGPNSPIGLATGRGLNENLGREILELHTLGVGGGYSQRDVEEMAMLLTGLRVRKSTGEMEFNWAAAEPGSKTVLGVEYGGIIPSLSAILDALDDLAAHPSTAAHVCRKLAQHFLSDTPRADVVNAMTEAFIDGDGYLPDVYEIMFEAAKGDDPFQKFKSPRDFVLSGLRALGAPERAFEGSVAPPNMNRTMTMSDMDGEGDRVGLPDLTIGALSVMGHRLLSANGPDGWPDVEAYWLNADGMAKRLDWSSRAALLSESSGPEFLNAALGDLASAHTQAMVASAQSGTQGVILALMSPEFNRR